LNEITRKKRRMCLALMVWMRLSSGQARDGIGWSVVRVGAKRENPRQQISREARLSGSQSRDRPRPSSQSRDFNLSSSLSRAIHLSAERRLGFRFWTQLSREGNRLVSTILKATELPAALAPRSKQHFLTVLEWNERQAGRSKVCCGCAVNTRNFGCRCILR
jgi:hypothetical protein